MKIHTKKRIKNLFKFVYNLCCTFTELLFTLRSSMCQFSCLTTIHSHSYYSQFIRNIQVFLRIYKTDINAPNNTLYSLNFIDIFYYCIVQSLHSLIIFIFCLLVCYRFCLIYLWIETKMETNVSLMMHLKWQQNVFTILAGYYIVAPNSQSMFSRENAFIST